MDFLNVVLEYVVLCCSSVECLIEHECNFHVEAIMNFSICDNKVGFPRCSHIYNQFSNQIIISIYICDQLWEN